MSAIFASSVRQLERRGRNADGSNAAARIVMHVVTAVVIVAGFSLTLPARDGCASQLCARRWASTASTRR
jgi:hypothetical protein